MKIEILREKRRSIVLKVVNSEKSILKVPKGLSEKDISKFIESKKKWLMNTAFKFRLNESFAENFDLKQNLYLKGEKVLEFKMLNLNFQGLTQKQQQKVVREFYFQHFYILKEIVQRISNETGLAYNEIKMINSVRVWGSFNTAGIMKLNWKLVLLPVQLIEYVICHELCHGLQMNHSSKFWENVSKICPDYKKHKKELYRYSFLLKDKF